MLVMKEGVRLGLSEIGSGARASHFALFRGIVHAPISTLYLLQSEFGCVIFYVHLGTYCLCFDEAMRLQFFNLPAGQTCVFAD